ncbi:MAG: UvrD-helicase domain-containing protein [Clostridia bacterium]|nr:UvrD-helicase domain-containing protein [Clostridia bacterium]
MDCKKEFCELRNKIIKKEFSRLNEVQFEAVTSVNGPLLILSGAGSGKTTVLINRIVNMIKYGEAYNSDICGNVNEQDVQILQDCLDGKCDFPSFAAVNPVAPWNILAITFTNKAARELKERLDKAVGEVGNDIWAATFHSTCARILRRYAEKIGFSSKFTIYDANDQRKLMKEIQKQLNIDEKFLAHRSILNEISRAKDSMISPDEYMAGSGSDVRKTMIARAYEAYQNALLNNDAMDFDDLIYNTIRLLENNEDVLEYWQNKFKFVMIDEYQDTNYAQYVLAKMLAGKYKNICVVGDDDQSIYRFRGATIENILNFENQYKGCKTIRLEQNYRSTSIILDAANSVIANNRNRKGKHLWTDKNGGEKIVVYSAKNEQDEARFVAESILDNMNKGYKESDFAVIYRMNAQSNAVENVFARSGIRYRVYGGLKFFDRKEIKDVLSYLNLINNPKDNIALMRIINEPKRSIGATTVSKVNELSLQTGSNMLEIMRYANHYESLKSSASKLMQFTAMIDELSVYADEAELHDLFEKVLEDTGYMAALKSLGEEGADRIENVNELLSNIVNYERENENASLSGFLEEISLITDMDREEEDDNQRVSLMTMHTAKGLEYPVVYIIGVEEGIFPGNQSIFAGEAEIEEERRLAYVGITRAKERLFISNAYQRMLFGRTERMRESRFIGEINRELIERKMSNEMQSYGYGSYNNNNSYSRNNYCDTKVSYYEPKKPTSTPIARSSSFGPTQNKTNYSVGERVKHKTFGEGMITSVTNMGNDSMLEIAFDSVGTKKVMANFARLEKI